MMGLNMKQGGWFGVILLGIAGLVCYTSLVPSKAPFIGAVAEAPLSQVTHPIVKGSGLPSVSATVYSSKAASTPKNEAHESNQFVPPPARARDITWLKQEEEGKKIPADWVARIHRAAPGTDWQAIEAQSLQRLQRAGQQAQGRTLITGNWLERGPANVPGRITDIDLDYAHNHLYALSDHGIVFRSSDLNGTDWQALNDQHPLALDVSGSMKVIPGTNGSRILVSGYIKSSNGWGVFYSDDQGESWQDAQGLEPLAITGIKRMMTQGDTVFLFMQEYDGSVPTDYLTVYRSIDRGAHFSVLYRSAIPPGDGWRNAKSDLWVSNDLSDPHFYLVLEDSLFVVNKYTGSRQLSGLVSGQTPNQSLLTGIAHDGVLHLYAYEARGDVGEFYYWNSQSTQWQYQGALTEWWLSLPFGKNSFSCSQTSPGVLYFGGILTSQSLNGGANWTTIDLDPTGSYALYHGDVPKTLNIVNPLSGQEETYMGTDGGLYRLDRPSDHFIQLGVPGLNCTQIYKMVSQHQNPGKMFIGTQDNGYARTLVGGQQTGAADFNGIWGGDVTNMATGDDGQTFWVWWWGEGCNYVTDPDTDEVSSTWSPSWQQGQVPYWEAPIWVSTHRPDQCFTAGYLNGGSGSHLIRVQAMPGADAVGTAYPFDFQAACGGIATAVAVSPLDSNYLYVATENGYLFSSADAGLSWSSIQMAPYFYARCIYPSKQNLGELWVGGSGYSNSPIFHSTNHGLTVEPYNQALPSCLVEALVANEDESLLFAATSIAPFACETATQLWSGIAGDSGPLVHYMDVDFIPSTQSVRYATYARGIWDFNLSQVTDIAEPATQPFDLRVFPNPTAESLSLSGPTDLGGRKYTIYNAAGQLVLWGTLQGITTSIEVSGLPQGSYWLLVQHPANPKPVAWVKE